MINYIKQSDDEVSGINFDPNSIMGYESAFIRDKLLDFIYSYKNENVLLQSIGNGGIVSTIGSMYTIVSFEHLIHINYTDIKVDNTKHTFVDVNLLTGTIRTNVKGWPEKLLLLMKDIYTILRIEN